MITVTHASEQILNRSRYLTEALSKDLINISSLARYMKPEIEQMTLKEVSEASIIMSLTRLAKKIHPNSQYQSLFIKTPEITVRSPLSAIQLAVSDLALSLKVLAKNSHMFYRVSAASEGITIIGGDEVIAEISSMFKSQQTIFSLAAISITLPKNALDTPGAFYFFLKSLTWEHINIRELFTQRNDFTIIVNEKDADRAYGVIRSLFV